MLPPGFLLRLFENLELISEMRFCKTECPVYFLNETFPADNFIAFLAPRKSIWADVFIITVLLFI